MVNLSEYGRKCSVKVLGIFLGEGLIKLQKKIILTA
jgi:hypothetical protein